MAGQIIKRGERKNLVRVFTCRDENGKRRYLNKTINGTKKAAEQRLNGALRDKDLGPSTLPAQVRLGELFDGIRALIGAASLSRNISGAWEQGRKVAAFLFLLLLGCGIWDIGHPDAPVVAALRGLWP